MSNTLDIKEIMEEDRPPRMEGYVSNSSEALAYKYFLTHSGVNFVVNAESISTFSPDSEIHLATSEFGSLYFRIGPILALINDQIIDHLMSVLDTEPEVAISISRSLAHEYAILPECTMRLGRSNCAMLASMYKLSRRN